MNRRVLRRRIEKAQKKHKQFQELVYAGLITDQEAKEKMIAYLKKHLAILFRR